VSFLSRSTQESGLSQKDKKRNEIRKEQKEEKIKTRKLQLLETLVSKNKNQADEREEISVLISLSFIAFLSLA